MVHIKRYDAFKIMLQNILQIIYFFNPVVWYANRQISFAREEICDFAVLASGVISPSVYGDSILKALKFNLFGSEHAGFLPGFGGHKNFYKRRIQNIIEESAVKMQKKLFIVMAVCLLGVLILPVANYISAAQGEGGNIGSNELKIVLPINGKKISSLFGWRKNPVTKGKDFHNGVDIVASAGTPIFAATDGLVIKAGWENNGYGNLIVLQHDKGYSTAYAKCRKILVKEGETIKAGDTIAECGMTGTATGNHLHFEIRKDGKPIDPYPYLPKNIPVSPMAKEGAEK